MQVVKCGLVCYCARGSKTLLEDLLALKKLVSCGNISIVLIGKRRIIRHELMISNFLAVKANLRKYNVFVCNRCQRSSRMASNDDAKARKFERLIHSFMNEIVSHHYCDVKLLFALYTYKSLFSRHSIKLLFPP